jgi:predicted NBD/HSP70 family sugar kinase
VLTLGTGVGCGLVFEGRIFRGTRFASEFGHCVVSPSGFSDSSGLRGTLEAQCNGASVVKRCREGGVFVTDAAHASTLAIEGNRVCRRVMQETGYWAGVGIANLVNALHLDRVVLAGGLSHSGLLVVSAKKTALKHLYPSFAKGLSIRVSDLEMGAAVGAALRARSDEA